MKRMLALLALTLSTCTPPPAYSQNALCGPWPDMKRQFAERHGETEVSVGQINQDTVLVILASVDGATWSAIEVRRDGASCLRAAGVGWEPGHNPVRPEVRG